MFNPPSMEVISYRYTYTSNVLVQHNRASELSNGEIGRGVGNMDRDGTSGR